MTKGSSPKIKLHEIKAARKKDALALAYLIYDIFKEERRNDKMVNGQNNVQSSGK